MLAFLRCLIEDCTHGFRSDGFPETPKQEREFFIDNLLVRIHFIIVMTRWTGLTPWEFEFPFQGSLPSFLEPGCLRSPPLAMPTLYARAVIFTSDAGLRVSGQGLRLDLLDARDC